MLRCILFDFDGIIVDAEPIHLKAFQEVLSQIGISLSEEEYFERYLALDDRTLFSHILRDRNMTFDDFTIEDCMQRKSRSYDKLMIDNIRIFPGVIDFVNTVFKRYALGIGSGALRHEIEFILDHAGIKDKFGVIVSAEDVVRCKPDPEVYIKAVQEINKKFPHASKLVDPSECLVIEDSVPGIRAARVAGMKALAITNSYSRDKLSEANLIANSLAEVGIVDLEKLF